VTAVSPDIGPLAGGTSVAITGTGFVDGSTSVAFGTTPATDIVVTSSSTLTAMAPTGLSGSVDVTVTVTGTGGGTSAANPYDLFAYGPPSVSGLNPGAGLLAGGSVVTVTGTAFVPGATASFGTIAATNVTVTSGTTLQATAPAGVATGDVDVTVTTPGPDGGTSATSYADLYAYAAPTLTALAPDTGLANTATTVTITGTNFSPGDTVTFGTTDATDVTVWGPSVITATSPGTLQGGVDVTVSNSDGTSPISVTDQFAAGPPTVTNISPSGGPAAGGGTVTVTGDGFVAGAGVAFGGAPAAGVTIVSPRTLVATPPPGGNGSVNVSVATPLGT